MKGRFCMLKIENFGFECGNCVCRNPHLYGEVVVPVTMDNTKEFNVLDFREVIGYVINSSIGRLDNAYKELALGGSLVGISKGYNCVQRKFRSMILNAVSKELWFSNDPEYVPERNRIMADILNSNRFRRLSEKLYQSIDKKIMKAYIQEAYDMLTPDQQANVDNLIKIKMKYMGNRVEFSISSKADISEVSVLITPRVQLDVATQPTKFPLVFNAVDHYINKEVVWTRDVFNKIIFNSTDFILNIEALEASTFTTEQSVAIDFILCTLFGRTRKYILENI